MTKFSSSSAASPNLFSDLAPVWWDKNGIMSALHTLNPARLAFIRQAVATGLSLSLDGKKPYKGLKMLDVGCGGGVLSEPLARLGAEVTGLDASEQLIAAAKAHAKDAGLPITYVSGYLADYKGKDKFDVIVLSEVLEHVDDVPALIAEAVKRLKPKGILVATTLNRTLKSLTLGIWAAEYIFGLVERGSHQWDKFIRPSELVGILEAAGLTLGDLSGLRYNPLSNSAKLHPTDLAINYLVWAQKT